MMNAVSYCIYGPGPSSWQYFAGALLNARLCAKHYRDWDVAVSYDASVPQEVLDRLGQEPNVKLFDRAALGLVGGQRMLWRFLFLDQAEPYDIFLSRDTDSRVCRREAAAVYDWMLDGSCMILAMHDSISHNDVTLCGGMVGFSGIKLEGIASNIVKFASEHPERPSIGWDQYWLWQYVQPLYADSLYLVGGPGEAPFSESKDMAGDAPQHVGAPWFLNRAECDELGIGDWFGRG
jgi:hypothetical protein